MNPRKTVAVIASGLLLLPAGASAADPLLSGYGGPGSGEQVVLGSKLLPAKNGDGSLRRAAPAPPAPAAENSAPDSEATAPAAAPAPPGSAGGSAPASSSSGVPESGTPVPAVAPGAGNAASDEAATLSVLSAGYPTRAGEASGLPLSRTDLALLLAALAVVATVALVSRRVVRRTTDPLRPTAGDPLRG